MSCIPGLFSEKSVTRSNTLFELSISGIATRGRVSFNTGETAPIAFINKESYKQYNLDVGDGLEGFGAMMKNAPPQGFKSGLHCIFADGDTVIAHRLEDGLIVEHCNGRQYKQDVRNN